MSYEFRNNDILGEYHVEHNLQGKKQHVEIKIERWLR